jgi:glycosyltransferase involved in cell wall biosynthesis
MRIAIVIHSLERGGAERVAVKMAHCWTESGHDVAIITLARPKSPEYRLCSGVTRMSLDLATASRNFLGALKNNAKLAWALRRAIKTYEPRVVIAMMTETNVLSALACFAAGRLSIGCERIHPAGFPPGRAWQEARKFAYRLHDAIAAQTRETANWLADNTFARRIAVIPNPLTWPIPIDEPVVAPAAICRTGRKIVLGVGRLTAQKGFAHLLAAFAGICRSRPDWDLVILGEGSERAALEDLGRELGIADRLMLPGAVGNIADWYARASIFAFSSLFEGFPNALAEAMASGLPAVSFDCDTGPREIIRHGVDGLLVPLGDGAALANSLAELMDDAPRRNQLASRAVEIRERLSEGHVMREWDRLFRAIGVHTGDIRPKRPG